MYNFMQALLRHDGVFDFDVAAPCGIEARPQTHQFAPPQLKPTPQPTLAT